MKEALTQIYQTFQKPLLYYIMRNVSQKDVAEDILQEVFLKAYKNFDTLKEKQNIQAWLYKIASNTLIDYFRKKRLPTQENNEIMIDEEHNSEMVIEELDCCLKNFIEKLPTKQKEILTAVYFEEYSLVEYAQHHQLNLSTVKSQAKRAKEKLKEVFYQCCQFETNQKNEIVDYIKKDSTCYCEKKDKG